MNMFWVRVVIGGVAVIGAAALTVKVVRCPNCGSFHTHKEKELSTGYDFAFGTVFLHGLHTFEAIRRVCDDCEHVFRPHERYVGKGHPNEHKQAA